MKIGINVSFARKLNTGIGQVALNYLKTLSKKSQDIEYVLYLEEDLSEDIRLPKNFTTKVFLPPYKRDDLIRKIWWEKFCLPRKVKKDKCDAFISLYQCPTIMPKNIKHTMVVHDIIPKIFPEYLNNFRKKFYWKLVEKAIKKADKIITISENSKKDIEKCLNISPKKIEVRYLDVDEIYKEEVSDEESQRVLKKYTLEKGYIYSGGGLEKRKNIETLLKAYKSIVDNSYLAGRQVQLTIPRLVISGKLMPELVPLITDVKKVAEDLKINNVVKFLDFVPQKDLPALYKNASMFVYPSLYEGFGMPPLEAMNQGAPVIMAKNSSLPEVGGDAVEYFNSDNKNDLMEKIEKVLNNEDLQRELSEKGEMQAKKFSWDKFVK